VVTSATRAPAIVPGQRLRALDALRGVAAMAVVFYHLFVFTPIGPTLSPVIPRALVTLFEHGDLGVQVFFVLSGVVIALAVSGQRITGSYVARFALRRSIRLDPPYWAALAIAVPLLYVAGRPPAMGNILAHVVYLQNILGYPNIVVVFWTLCYEVQFYLVLVLLIGLAQRWGRAAGLILAVAPFVWSLWFLGTGIGAHGFFIDWWYAFAIGVATTAMLTDRLSVRAWILPVLAVVIIGLVRFDPRPLVVAGTATFIAALGWRGLLAKWSGGTVLQWVGRISYSLYLTHFLAGAFAKVVGPRITTPIAAGALLCGAILCALVIADMFYRLVEQPSHRLATRVRLQAQAVSATPADHSTPRETAEASTGSTV
jgi:peptidoglycan/LPS O-acetylase OafA/YrhL